MSETMAIVISINQEGFGGSEGIGSFDLWPPLPHSIVAAVLARVALCPTCGKPYEGRHYRNALSRLRHIRLNH